MRIIVFIICGFFLTTAIAQEDQLLNKAVTAIDKEDYKSCIDSYEQLINQGYASSDLFYNLAHCYYHDEQLAKAVLHYNKVLKIDEYHKEAINNLQIVNDQRASEISLLPDFFLKQWWVNVSGFFSAGIWALFFLMTLVLCLYLFWKWLYSPGRRKLYMSWLMITAILMLLVFSLGYSKYKRSTQTLYLVNMEIATLYKGPDNRSGEVLKLIPGERLTLLDQRNDWYKVVLPNKEIGWILKSQTEGI